MYSSFSRPIKTLLSLHKLHYHSTNKFFSKLSHLFVHTQGEFLQMNIWSQSFALVREDGLMWRKMSFKCIIYSDSHSRIRARSLCKIYLRKWAIHAYNVLFSSFYPFPRRFQVLPLLFVIIPKPKIHYFHFSPNEHYFLSFDSNQPGTFFIYLDLDRFGSALFFSFPPLTYCFLDSFFLFFLFGSGIYSYSRASVFKFSFVPRGFLL